ncbi:ribosomal protein S18 acetylase RimI-like enzyme [Nonomuraea polychroma]|uniref:Ribosomal protein S18 acetylase RimI-like enzyme n=1 Tax=Nonomuraea polychroma TaxID=46176 RepID=A0A438M9X1_9ACTN|nr:GNAT family N-acetyltransferase [Nonomuraea polychroma]RVX42514.1 ribosomal protein S18 acetylase RimI-like enzyme [Nonomuraea polychroma]
MKRAIEVRPATPEDAATLARLNDFVHALHVNERPDVFHPPSSAEELVSLFGSFLARENALAFVADSSEGPVGYVTATIHQRPGDVLTHPRSFVFLEHIAIDPAVARTGVGAALVESVRVAGKDAGCTSLLTDVWDFNRPALAFFGASGLAPMRHWLEQPL